MLFNCVLGFFVVTGAVLMLPARFATTQPIQRSISITIADNLVYLPVKLNGQGPYHFMLDLNEPGMGLIDQHVAKDLGLTIVGFEEISNGTRVKRAFLVGIHQLTIGQVTQSNLKLRVGDYNTTPRQIPIDGIIGRAFFANHLLTIDGPGRQLITSPNTLLSQHKDGLPYTIPFLVSGTVGSKKMAVNLTIGSNPYLLFPMTSLEGVHYTTTPNQRMVTQTGTPFVLQEAILHDELTLGGVRLKNQKIYYSDKAHQINVGTDFLKEHSITLDQRNKLIQIE